MRKLLMILLILLLPLTTLAEGTALTLLDMPEEDQQRFLQNVSLVAWEEDYADRPIVCFDVREDGWLALGFERLRGGKYVAVLDAEGAFQYGYTFQCTGSFLVDWTDEGLGIIWIRSDVIAVFDEKGTCLSVSEFDTDSASSRYMNVLSKTSRTVGDVTYTLRNDHILSGLSVNYGRLVRTDAQGNEVILHDASGGALAGAVGVIAVIAFVAVCAAVSMRRNRATKD